MTPLLLDINAPEFVLLIVIAVILFGPERLPDLARKAERRDTEALYETDAAVREALFGNDSTAKQRVGRALELSKSRDVEYGAAFALALSGDPSRAQALSDELARRVRAIVALQ